MLAKASVIIILTGVLTVKSQARRDRAAAFTLRQRAILRKESFQSVIISLRFKLFFRESSLFETEGTLFSEK